MNDALLQACFAIWCLGGVPPPEPWTVMATQDVYNNVGIENRLVAVSRRWLIGGYAYLPDSRDVAFAGAVPLRIRFHPRLWLYGGAVLSTGELPRRGTLVNWLARVQLRLTDLVALEVVHVSNGGPGDTPNPTIDSIGVSIRFQ